jgi:hypothetical protein
MQRPLRNLRLMGRKFPSDDKYPMPFGVFMFWLIIGAGLLVLIGIVFLVWIFHVILM